MSAIVAILILGVKMAKNKPPIELKNLKLESKVSKRDRAQFNISFFRVEEKEMLTLIFGNVYLV
jgi:hypothetical protein